MLRRALPEREWRAVRAWLSTFYTFQLAWLLDPSSISALVKARQIGASHTYAAAVALWTILGETTILVSITEDDAQHLLGTVEKHLRVLAALGSTFARPAGREYQSGNTLTTASGGVVVARPSTNAGRSRTGNVVLDEFAYHINPDKVWDAAGAVTTHGGRMRVLSTPNGVGNLFHKLCTDPGTSAGWRIHRVTIDEARASGFPVDDARCWKLAHGDPRLYDQLYRCSFLSADEQYIPTEAVVGCSVDVTSQPAGAVYAGLDIGLRNDLSVLAITRTVSEEREVDGRKTKVPVVWLQHLVTWKRTLWDVQERAIDELLAKWPVRRLCVDATGLGAVPAERLVRRHGARIEPVDFTPSSKEELATGLYTHFADRRVRIPISDAKLRDDVCSLRRLITAAGNVRYDAARTADGHADRAWALALAIHAGSRPIPKREMGTERLLPF